MSMKEIFEIIFFHFTVSSRVNMAKLLLYVYFFLLIVVIAVNGLVNHDVFRTCRMNVSIYKFFPMNIRSKN